MNPAGHRGHRSGAQDVALAFATRVGVVLLGLVVQAMLARMLLPEGRGGYAVCLVFATALGMLLTPGAQQGAQQFVMTREVNVSQAVSCALAICLVGGAVAVAVSLPLIGSGLSYFQKATGTSFHIALALLPITAFALAVEHQLAALRRFGRLATVSLLRMLANVLAVLVFVRLCDLGVGGALWAMVCANGVMIVVCLWDLRRHCGLAFRVPELTPLLKILGYGFRYHIARAAEGLGPHMGVFFLGLWASDAQIGLFAAASALMLGFLLMSNSVGNALLPRIASSRRGSRGLEGGEAATVGRPELVATCLRLVGVATAGALLAMLAVAAPLVRLLFSEAFLPALPVLWLIAPGMVASACAGILMTYFKAVNRPGLCSWAHCVGFAVEICALCLLFPWFGIAAAGCAVTLGMVCRCVHLAIVFRKATGMRWGRIWLPRRADVGFVLAHARSLGGAPLARRA